MGPISLKRLSAVHPVLSSKIQQLERDLEQPLGVTQGLRSSDEQAALYAQGRDSLDVVNQKRALVGWAPITDTENTAVTNAAPGESYHEFGLAVDVVPEALDTGAPDWNVNHPVWQDLVKKGQALGMTSGISWHDEPHFQLQGTWPIGRPVDNVIAIYEQGGLQAVWTAAGLGEGT